jgi:hypothetical protein
MMNILQSHRSTPWWLGLAPLLVSGTLLAADGAANPPAPAAKELPADGSLGRALFGDSFGATSGLKLGGWIEGGYAINNNVHGSQGIGDSPIVLARDSGLQLNQVYAYFEKAVNSNVIPRVTPTPAPMPQEYAFGWKVDALYGRDGQVFQTYGWDSRWSANKPGNYDSTSAQDHRQLFLVVPEAFLQGYLPWYKGMDFLFGMFMSPCGHEIGMNPEPTPDFFYSHSYALESQPVKQSGLLWDANLVNNKAFGLLAVELGITTGWSNLKPDNYNPTYDFALRYRTMDMRTWVDLFAVTGNGAANANKVGFPQNAGDRWFGDSINAPTTRVISPRAQNRSEAVLDIYRDFTDRFRAVIEFNYGKMRGDGQPDTVDIVTGPGFSGATWSGILFEAQYKLTSTLSTALRAETFHDPDGFILFPNSSVKGVINEVTAGLQWQALKSLRVRPEVRYDWETENNGVGAFAYGTQTKQVTFLMDATYRY